MRASVANSLSEQNTQFQSLGGVCFRKVTTKSNRISGWPSFQHHWCPWARSPRHWSLRGSPCSCCPICLPQTHCPPPCPGPSASCCLSCQGQQRQPLRPPCPD